VDDDNWESVVTRFGYDYPCEGYQGPFPCRQVVEDDFIRVAEKLGYAPSVGEYKEHGKYLPRTFSRRVGDGDYNDAVRDLGYTPKHYLSEFQQRLTDEEIIEDFFEIVESLGRTPSSSEYRRISEHNSQTISRRFGGGKWKRGVTAVHHLYDDEYL
jgi:hypothetical protein